MKSKVPILLILLGFTTVMVVTQARGQPNGFIINGADGTSTLAFSSSDPLNTLIAQVFPHFIIDKANGVDYQGLNLSGDLQTVLAGLTPRIVFEFANASQNSILSYPRDLIGDTLPPIVTNLSVSQSGLFSWNSDEFTLGELRYGTQSGNYTLTYQETEYAKVHQIALSGLVEGTTIYYRVRNTDQSGNQVESDEYSFTVVNQKFVYIPMVKR